VVMAAAAAAVVRVLLVEVLEDTPLLLWLPLVETGLRLVVGTIPGTVHCGFAVVSRRRQTSDRGTNPTRRTQRSGPAWKEPPEHDARGSTCGAVSVSVPA
jgi:hypothetical protein